MLAASVAVLRGGRVLLARRGRPPLAGLYSLPGGRVEFGETLAEAALRELREEVAVEARIAAFNRHVEVIERGADGAVHLHFVVASFAAVWLAGEGRAGDEAADVLWATREDAAGLPVTAGLLPVIDGAMAMLASRRDDAPQ